jgi:hypothetical protein
MNVRTLIAALRHRLRQQRPDQAKTPWGIGPLVAHIEKHWEQPDFNLSLRFPWVQRAAGLLESGDSLTLQHLLLTMLWDFLDKLGQRHYFEFDFDFVLIYLFKWDILNRWLGYNEEQALQRLDELRAQGVAAYGQSLFAEPHVERSGQ